MSTRLSYEQRRGTTADARASISEQRHMPNVWRPTYLYRCFDGAGALLYVGCSLDPEYRVSSHRETSWWGSRIVTVRYTVFPDRIYALEREREAIYSEMPLCNVKGRWYRGDQRSHWTAQDYLDFHFAILKTATTVGATTSRLLRQVEQELAQRFGVHRLPQWQESA